jgi:hypothetical protein
MRSAVCMEFWCRRWRGLSASDGCVQADNQKCDSHDNSREALNHVFGIQFDPVGQHGNFQSFLRGGPGHLHRKRSEWIPAV